MSDFPGVSQVHAIIERLRSELRLTVLQAAAPRVFDGTWKPTSGGYGVTLKAALDVGAATDNGGGLVGIPATAHGFTAGEFGTMNGTASYDEDEPYRLDTTTATDTLVIPATYAAETFSATDFFARPGLPEHWGAGRITSTKDPLCPILEAWRWADLDAAAVLEDSAAFGGLTWADISGTTDTGEAENLLGSGYMLVETESLGEQGEPLSGARRTEECIIRVTVRVPANFGQAQGQLYCALLARVLGERQNSAGVRASNVFHLAAGTPDDYLQTGWAPEMGQISDETPQWLEFVWEVRGTRHYTIP